MGVITIYKVNQYQAYMASEQGVYFSLFEPSNTDYYKSENTNFKIKIPDGFKIIQRQNNCPAIVYGDYDVIMGENENGFYLEICSYHPKKIYPKII